jgi:hypothetical protein
MGECRANQYVNNSVVLRGAVVCHGWGQQKPCEHLEKCLADYNMKIIELKNGKRRIVRVKGES